MSEIIFQPFILKHYPIHAQVAWDLLPFEGKMKLAIKRQVFLQINTIFVYIKNNFND